MGREIYIYFLKTAQNVRSDLLHLMSFPGMAEAE
jgi:hypothetical protein